MRKKVARTLIWLGITVVILICVPIAVALFYPEEKLRELVLPRASEALGRSVDCARIGLQFGLRGFSLELEDLTLGPDPGAHGLRELELPRLSTRLAWGPLLHKEIEIESLHLEAPSVLFVTPPPGVETKTDRAGGSSAAVGQAAVAGEAALLTVAAPNVSISDASFRLLGADGLELNIVLRRARFASVIAPDGSLDLRGELNLDLEQTLPDLSLTWKSIDIELEAALDQTRATLHSCRIACDPLRIDVRQAGEDILLEGRRLVIDCAGSAPLAAFEATPPDLGALQSEISLTMEDGKLRTALLPAPLDIAILRLQGDLERLELVEMKLAGETSRLALNGELLTPLTEPRANLSLKGTMLDLADFLAPGAEIEPARESVAAHAGQGTADSAGRKAGQGWANSAGQGASAPAPTAIPLLLLPGTLDIALDEFRHDRVRLHDLRGKVETTPEGIRLSDLHAGLYGGELDGGLYLSPAANGAADCVGSFRVEQVDAREFLAAFTAIRSGITGKLSSSVDLSLEIPQPSGDPAADAREILNRLSLDALADLGGGSLQNVSAVKQLCGLVGLPRRDAYPLGDLRLPISLRQGRVHTEDLAFMLEGGAVRARGSAGLDGSLDYRGDWELSAATLARLGGDSIVSWLKDEQGGVKLSFLVGGDVKSPNITLDTKALEERLRTRAEEAVKDALEEQVEETLEEEGAKLLKKGLDALRKFR